MSGRRSSDPPPSARVRALAGIAGAPGVAIGTAVVLGTQTLAYPRRHVVPQEFETEIGRFQDAVAQAQRDLREVAAQVGDRRAETSILEAYLLMMGDDALADAVKIQITEENRSAEWAVAAACASLAGRLALVNDPYLRERSHDIEFVGERLIRAFEGVPSPRTIPQMDGPSILVAHDLSPADTAALAGQPVIGFVTEVGTRTSHTSIMARALEIPAVVGVSDATQRIATGDLVVVDGMRGAVLVRPGPEELKAAHARADRHHAHARELSEGRDRAAVTADGVRVQLRANVELPAEAVLAREQGADGIGLYRTEFLYIDRASPPTEEQQFEIFRKVVQAMGPKPVTLRTFDIGGDKFVSTFPLPPEMNPMLGLRAVRLALSRPDVFLEHLRAMVRASAFGDVRIMIPMVAGLNELRQVRALLAQAQEEVRARGQACADEIPLGVMIEVPAAAVLVDHFAREAAFLSLGTNDLIQYALAVDRTSRSLAYLASPFDPSILRLILNVIRAGRDFSRPVCICGAMASDPLAAVLLLGLGMRDFSMEAAAIPEIKEALRRVSLAEAEQVAAEALSRATAEEVEACVAGAFAPRLCDLLASES
ncbi:phosphoenolpyruvate--protein phosphotransferase [Chondromyces apiculatus]|uniref:Phosphoenolpyruvate-protein phosphotransferase n=1 Tax=Chondromyces apiculatus DSM 436 TaxID=1192034 RepID=A0A017TJ30_9BACT|nr:phosphoenolpyruvate--protein phosphotransferase [Chondromyces apiculatus]EYF08606.1 Phosphoenolpyruvate-protein phosphotransferase of PTS system [Chondromyces apiculatus DSM 436]